MNATQEAHLADPGEAPSQTDLVLAHLRANPGWVAMPELVRMSGSFNCHSRISDLRKKGHVIEQETRKKPGDRTNFSFYRLLP